MEAKELCGAFIVEVGVRQAWPFLTFAWPDRDSECRLYIGTTFRVDPKKHSDGGAERGASALWSLSNGTVTEVVVAGDGELTLSVDASAQRVLIVAGTPADFTTHDIWWFGSRQDI